MELRTEHQNIQRQILRIAQGYVAQSLKYHMEEINGSCSKSDDITDDNFVVLRFCCRLNIEGRTCRF